jgi:hypothetical protein
MGGENCVTSAFFYEGSRCKTKHPQNTQNERAQLSAAFDQCIYFLGFNEISFGPNTARHLVVGAPRT